MSPSAENVIERLDGVRQRWWLFTLLSTAVLAVCLSLGMLLLFVVADALLKVGQLALWAMLLTWLGTSAGSIYLVGRRLIRSQRSLEATARRIESEDPALGSHLINAVQLAEDAPGQHRAFREAAVNEAAARIGSRRFENAAAGQSRRRRFRHCMQTPRDLIESAILFGLLIGTAVLLNASMPNYSSAAGRLMSPWKFVPSVGLVEIVKVTPGDTEVLVGAGLPIAARVKNPAPQGKPYRAVLLVKPEGKEETRRPMSVDKTGKRFGFALPSVTVRTAYRLEIGDSQTRYYTVEVREKPTVADVQVTYRYPAYLGRDPKTVRRKLADLEAPQYTLAELQIHASVPIAKGHVQLGNRQIDGRVRDGGQRMVVELRLVEDARFTVHLFNSAGHTNPDPRVNDIHVVPDRPPTVEIVQPKRQSSAAPGSEVPVTVRAGDDYGVGRVRLEMKVPSSQPETDPAGTEPSPFRPPTRPPPIEEWTIDGSSTGVVRHHPLTLDPQLVRPGQTVSIRAVAWDRRSIDERGFRLKAQQKIGDWHTIRIVSEKAESAAALEQLDGLRNDVWRILQQQITARARAAMIRRRQSLTERRGTSADVRALQIDVQKASIAAVNSIGPGDSQTRLRIKRSLNRLAVGEMLLAVAQCDELAKVTLMEDFERPLAELIPNQDRIIDGLRKLLGFIRRTESEMLAERQRRPGGDLPDDVETALKQLDATLDEAVRQQKKVVEAAEDLAKAPVEDFAEEAEQLLEALAAAEDDWSRFLNELGSDLSKLPEQDFANPSLLEELVEIQTEIRMAEDVLLKQSREIAVPLEQLGAEMAEELKTNLEKWLPDTPDRERWSQEESLGDEGKEAPMAELPGELEDLIGELMEEEEDLFDEMEDASSSAADSLDKGAGWDTLDGPISNMSAKGATGNRLPNTSEIGGRAGEGRSGKSSGEFVAEQAVGKGGRKTPSRLTPDPYLKGQVKDHSQDPTGGATGGGKESGQGGEGLEGPLPRPPGPRELRRLAGRQAALRNKAEGIDLKLQIMNFHHTDLEKMIELMAQIERDLRAGRYQNALRRRDVMLDGLGNVKQYVEGEFELRRDTTVNLPADVQKEIFGSMQDPSPAGWEDLNRRYFQRLSAAGAETTEP